jgi:hypothetical protein
MGRCRCSLLVSEDETFEKRIQQALQEIIAHKESKAKDDDFQATFNRIILKFPVLRVSANRIPARQFCALPRYGSRSHGAHRAGGHAARPTHGSGAHDSGRSTPLCCTPCPRLQRAIASIREVFRTFDTDNSGSIDRRELGRCLRALGANMTELDIAHMFKVRAPGAGADEACC